MSDNKHVKPTFGATAVASTSPIQQRAEMGAVWQQNSKADLPYLNIKLNMPKSKLLELIASTTTEEVKVSFVAFPNKHKETGDNRPDFRIYEETKR
jgi:uncharacterized protein (DUF736 family)